MHLILWNSYCGSDTRGNLSSDLLKRDKWNIADYSTARPLGPHQMASWLRLNGYEVAVIDFCDKLAKKQLLDVTERYITSDTIAIGVSTTFWPGFIEPSWVVEARTQMETRHPRLKWMLGGSRETNVSLNWIKFDGYSEDGVLQFLGGETSSHKFDIKTATNGYTQRDFIKSNEVLSIEFGRGCQFRCKFCRFPLLGKKPGTYTKNMHLIREHLIQMYNEYGVTRYNFVDDTVNEDYEKIENMARLAQSLPFKLEWVGFCRADLIWARPHMINLLRESGMVSTFFGIESFDDKASKIVGKGWSGKHAKDFLLRLKDEWDSDISMHLGLITGLPHEPLDSLDEHNEWLIKNDIGKWRWAPLFVTNKKNNSPWLSEFDRNYDKYGIKFQHENSIYWHHDLATYEKAIAKSIDLQTKAFPYMRNTGFVLSDYCTTTGANFKDSMSMKWSSLFEDDSRMNIYNSMRAMVDGYVQSHLS